MEEENPKEMLESKIGQAKEIENRNNRTTLIGLSVIFIGSFFFAISQCYSMKLFH